ncbi:unnamed protein product [Rotaria socialis]|uniref:Uncharacterized protein n=1 Tax=Rotaria socialis TaxID=392032 RepID=A0A821A101_9BILA|nr:unnamed protein product [Rotaria socialis]CAF4567639.1 unnamed protein product [Rotaria socialis]
MLNIALTYNNMANIFNERSDYSLAIDCYLKALGIEVKHFSVDHFHMAVTYGNIAIAYDGQCNYTTAVEYHQKSLDILLKSATINQEGLSTSYFNFGSTLKVGNFSAALTMLEKTLEIKLTRLSSDYFELAALFNNIGLVHFNLTHHGKTLGNYNLALASGLKSLPKYPNYFAQIYDNIEVISKAAEDEATAIKYF